VVPDHVEPDEEFACGMTSGTVSGAIWRRTMLISRAAGDADIWVHWHTHVLRADHLAGNFVGVVVSASDADRCRRTIDDDRPTAPGGWSVYTGISETAKTRTDKQDQLQTPASSSLQQMTNYV